MFDISTLFLFRDLPYINGKWVDCDETIDVINPAIDNVIGSVGCASINQAKEAILCAEQAFYSWRETTAKHRSLILRGWYDLIMQNQKQLATILTVEMGKPFDDAMGEIAYGASFIEWFSEEAKRVYGDVIPNYAPNQRSLVIKQPVGVVGAITPWNFPNAMIARKVAPALAVGCTVVLKPSINTPYSALALAELGEQAGIPAGVFNVITGDAKTLGYELCSNPIVRKISFTGSTSVGKILIKQCADTVKKVSMELGGNAPSIVFEDADIDQAVQEIMISKFRNSGQTCVCTNRIYVHESILDEFVSKFSNAVKELKIGNGMKEGVQQGPLIDKKAMNNVHKMVEGAIKQGATLLLGGKAHSLGHSFYEPTILCDLRQDMDIANQEIFGPVAPIFTFSDEKDVINKANDTEYGLACYFYSRDIGKIWRVSEKLDYGIVAINTGALSSETIPFGGVKQSGTGREGSKYGTDDYTIIKHINIAGI